MYKAVLYIALAIALFSAGAPAVLAMSYITPTPYSYSGSYIPMTTWQPGYYAMQMAGTYMSYLPAQAGDPYWYDPYWYDPYSYGGYDRPYYYYDDPYFPCRAVPIY